jgi:type II secretory pathway pseudopilin PulG
MKTKQNHLVATLIISLLFAAALLPALLHAQVQASDKAESQRKNCINQMKQIGLAFRIWEGDNSDRYPFNVPQKQGGTLEFCSIGADGFDRNAWRHFLVMSNELSTPKILVCPADSSRKSATQFSSFGANNLTYQLHSGKGISDANPDRVLAHCPIHNIDLMCDGSVIQRNQ